MKYCVLGKKLSHTLSPDIHKQFFKHYDIDAKYGKREVSEKELKNIRRIIGEYDGLNVTVPYKEKVIAALDDIVGDAAALGAVNTIVRQNDKYLGYNTDTYGFEALLRYNKINVKGKICVVLGSGGASKSVQFSLAKGGAKKVIVVSRKPQGDHISYQQLQKIKGYLIVNTTPVGMSPNVGESPVDEKVLSHFKVAVDVVYNPAMTEFLALASQQGLYVANGLYMLVAQALKSQEYWQGIKVDEDYLNQVYHNLKADFDRENGANIYLVGMMGCGKSTAGTMLAQTTDREFVDSDSEIEKECGKSITQIFESEGEPAFRRYETKSLAKLCKNKGMVVATGGGIVKNSANVSMMRTSGSVMWLNRDPHLIIKNCDVKNRPVLKGNSNNVLKIFKERKPLYQAAADFEIVNDGDVSKCVASITKTAAMKKSNITNKKKNKTTKKKKNETTNMW
ncbi:MAG: shikimate kinase [Christensenellales bacterium]